MRRPLFAICLCLVTIAALWLWLKNSSGERGEQVFAPPGEEITVTGRVKDVIQCCIIYTQKWENSVNQVWLKCEVKYAFLSCCGAEAFMGRSLPSVNPPGSLQVIGTRAFRNRTNLKSMN